MLEKDDTRELITVTEKLIQQYKEEIALLEHALTDATINIWSEITSGLAREMELILGDKPKLIWAAMSGVTKPGYLPFVYDYNVPREFKICISPSVEELKVLREKLWNELVGTN